MTGCEGNYKCTEKLAALKCSGIEPRSFCLPASRLTHGPAYRSRMVLPLGHTGPQRHYTCTTLHYTHRDTTLALHYATHIETWLHMLYSTLHSHRHYICTTPHYTLQSERNYTCTPPYCTHRHNICTTHYTQRDMTSHYSLNSQRLHLHYTTLHSQRHYTTLHTTLTDLDTTLALHHTTLTETLHLHYTTLHSQI